MPKKKSNPAEESMQPDSLPETGTEDFPQPMEVPMELPPEEQPQDVAMPNDTPAGENDIPIPSDDAGLLGDGDNPPEVVDVEVPLPAEPPAALPMDEPPMEPQEPEPAGGAPAEDVPPYGRDGQDTPPPAPAPPMTDRQSFFAMDFREVDRGLTAEERQAWNSIYASYRGHSALSGKIIGADPHSMHVRNKETGAVERRTMYCVV